MAHHPSVRNSKEMFGKLERELVRFEKDFESDTFLNLVLTAWSLNDWIKRDPNVPQSAKDALPAFREQVLLQACRDLSNGTKHFSLSSPDPVVADATLVAAFGAGRFGAGAYGVGEGEIRIELKDGTTLTAIDLAQRVTSLWRGFFRSHGI